MPHPVDTFLAELSATPEAHRRCLLVDDFLAALRDHPEPARSEPQRLLRDLATFQDAILAGLADLLAVHGPTLFLRGLRAYDAIGDSLRAALLRDAQELIESVTLTFPALDAPPAELAAWRDAFDRETIQPLMHPIDCELWSYSVESEYATHNLVIRYIETHRDALRS